LKRRISIALAAAVALALCGPAAQAMAAPVIVGSWPSNVTSSAVNLRAEIDPNGETTKYHFDYTTEAAFLANGFSGAPRAPTGNDAGIGTGTVLQPVGALASGTTYRFRAVATNSGTSFGPARSFTTSESTQAPLLADDRGWEMVSPIEKNGGEIQSFGGNFGGGVLQAGSGGGSITYTSAYSFGAPQGSPGASQYVSRRGTSSWTTENITAPAVSGGYEDSPSSGVPYQLFSGDLLGALLDNGRRCRNNAATQCPVENPPLAGSGAPAGYRNYYLRDNSSGSFKALLTSADLGALALGPEDFELAYAGATPDLAHVVVSTCAALTPGATELPGFEGECDPAATNLYEKSGTTLKLINGSTPGAKLAAQDRAISGDGSRVYWTLGNALHLQSGNADTVLGGGLPAAHPEFQTASGDGTVALFTEEGHLFRAQAGGATMDLTPGGGVVGVLGASDDAAYVYYVTASGLFLWHSGSTSAAIAPDVAADSYPPTTGTARVDGRRLVFVSAASGLTPFDNRNANSGKPEAEVYLYKAPASGAGAGALVCVSCRPSGERPGANTVLASAPAAIPGASFNGIGFNKPHSYKPRVLAAGLDRVFFNSFDSLAAGDTNGDQDVYEWEANGTGSCVKPAGCLNLISSGRSEGGASFLDASADGSDAFFLTDGSLIQADPGSDDVYDARVGGGFPDPPSVIPCFGDACQPLPPEPEDLTPGTLRPARSNPPVVLPKARVHCKKSQVKKKGKCVKKKKQDKKRGGGK
jgi:hypothetical protein